jgi:hypothetical protein
MSHTLAFNRLWKSMEKEYLYKDVPKKYQKRYGKKYDKKDVKAFTYAVSKSRGIKIDK